MDGPTLFAFAAASTVLLLVPGPAVTFVLARSLHGGRHVGLTSVVGLHIGTAVHIAASVLGLSALLVSSAAAFTVVRWAGGFYLVYLGIRAWRDRETDQTAIASQGPVGAGRAFREGIVVNVLNPKLAVFFLAYLPQFTDPASGSIAGQLLVLGALFVAIGLLTDGAYAIGAASVGARLRPGSKLLRNRNRIAGATYIGLGALALASPGIGRDTT